MDRSIADPVPFVRNNVDVMLNTLDLARESVRGKSSRSAPTRCTALSPRCPPHPEWAPILPSNPYSRAKAAQEALAIAWWRTYGMPLIITNMMNMFGERQGPEKNSARC